ncbi:hypothetical protein CQ010_01395 [Arthrobacter sp. MYb211]|uniref:hypothetical protein n=1 Tax=unclassified Arthrobacter TaxID=235627 RepID=UPI000CFAEFA7|nr:MULTISPECIES: hypothetical protein [unclassified Arthrobacter]PRA13329.1 hypothetical protein CQ015_03650 [Arthrobacter sp. MYb221]PRC10526.1 hypothetical protein CQ010_01395 [Arthrobacter sp. MYb211]
MQLRKNAAYPAHGLIRSAAYQHHVDHLLASLAQVVHPSMIRETLQRVDSNVAAGRMSRIQALTNEIREAVPRDPR